MRKSFISVRVPQTSYQIIEPHLQIVSKSPEIQRTSSKSYSQKSKHYIRTLTPSVNIKQQITQTSLPPSSEGNRLIRSVKLNNKRKTNTLGEVKLDFLPSHNQKITRELNKNTNSALFILENDINKSVEQQLFPKNLNKKTEFFPEICSFESLDWGMPQQRRFKRLCHRAKKDLLNSSSNWNRNVDDSIVRSLKLKAVTLKKITRPPRMILSRSIAKSVNINLRMR